MEVAALARLLGLRRVAVRQSGRRGTPPIASVWRAADAVWVPQHRELEPLDRRTRRRAMALHRALSRFESRPIAVAAAARRSPPLCVVGAGGSASTSGPWRAGGAPSGWRVVIAGTDERWCDRGVTSVGRIEDLGPLLHSAAVVVEQRRVGLDRRRRCHGGAARRRA